MLEGPRGALHRARRFVRARRAARLLAQSKLFDPAWYAANNPDVIATGIDPLWHFIRRGAGEGRRASPLFDTRWYLDHYPDIAALGVNPLLHYLTVGATQGRDPNPYFDSDWYLQSNPDVLAAGINPLVHYQTAGAAEGRRPSKDFDPADYVARHPEIEADVAKALEHLLLRTDNLSVPAHIRALAYRPLISIIVAPRGDAPSQLRLTLASVRAQSYCNWEVCLCDSGSADQETIDMVSEFARDATCVRIVRLAGDSGVSSAMHEALTAVKGEFVAWVRSGNELAPHALESCVGLLNRRADIDVLYGDEDSLDAHGRAEHIVYRPDWSPWRLRQEMYLGGLLLVRRGLIDAAGPFDPKYDGVQDYELALRLAERTDKICHVREVLYHRRRASDDDMPHSDDMWIAAVNRHLSRMGIVATARLHPTVAHRTLLLPLRRTVAPRISIVITSAGEPWLISQCINAIHSRTTYPNFEVVIVSGQMDGDQTPVIAPGLPVIKVPPPARGNFAVANNIGAAAANGDILVLLDSGIEVLEPGWLEQMLFLFDDPSVAIVGPILPPASDAASPALGWIEEVSRVTLSCAMIRRSDYDAVGGLQEFYAVDYQDADFCLRLRQRDRRILHTPSIQLAHRDPASPPRPHDALDRALFIDAWGETTEDHPSYIPTEPPAPAKIGAE